MLRRPTLGRRRAPDNRRTPYNGDTRLATAEQDIRRANERLDDLTGRVATLEGASSGKQQRHSNTVAIVSVVVAVISMVFAGLAVYFAASG